MPTAAEHGAPGATLWVALIREVPPAGPPAEEALALVSTRAWPDGFAAYQAYRPRWHVENDQFRELKAGWGLERQRWGRDADAARGRVTLTCLAFNTAQAYRTRRGGRLAERAIRRLRREHRPDLGGGPGRHLPRRLLRRPAGRATPGRPRAPGPGELAAGPQSPSPASLTLISTCLGGR